MRYLQSMLIRKKIEGELEAERWAENFSGQCKVSCLHTAEEHYAGRLHLACVFKDLLEEVLKLRLKEIE